MPSRALVGLRAGIAEVNSLQAAMPQTVGGKLPSAPIVSALGRASVVILYSHLERYIYSITTEAVAHVNSTQTVESQRLAERLRLEHGRYRIEMLLTTSWDARGSQLRDWNDTNGWLWTEGDVGTLEAKPILTWMETVDPKTILRYYALWGIEDVFSSITRSKHSRDTLWLKLKEISEKRHAIAHGDSSVQATPQDVSIYVSEVARFANGADKRLAIALKTLTAARPW